jgi:hypothetical protein
LRNTSVRKQTKQKYWNKFFHAFKIFEAKVLDYSNKIKWYFKIDFDCKKSYWRKIKNE